MLLAVFAAASLAQEQPAGGAAKAEHPTGKAGAEHPTAKAGAEHPGGKAGAEHPAKAAATPATIADVAMAVKTYVEHDTHAKGGHFTVFDTVAKEPLALTLDKIHDERLTPMGDGVYFVCADFKATNGHGYDVDFFMKETPAGLELTDVVTVHKVDGKARYSWVEKDGVWTRSQ